MVMIPGADMMSVLRLFLLLAIAVSWVATVIEATATGDTIWGCRCAHHQHLSLECLLADVVFWYFSFVHGDHRALAI